MISGISVSKGIVFGKALILKEEPIIIENKKINFNQIESEIESFLIGRKKTKDQLLEIKKILEKKIGKEKSEIFEGHIILLLDEELQNEIISIIKNKRLTTPNAVKKIFKKQKELLINSKNHYFKERISDLKDIENRLIRNVLNLPIIDLSTISKKVILVASDLTPSEIAQINFKNVLGFITNSGGLTSHTSIIARSLEIPAIVATTNATEIIKTDDYLILDSINNKIYLNPKKEIIQNLKNVKEKFLKEKRKLLDLKNLPAITIDKHKVKIYANVGSMQELYNIKYSGAEGIGLYRTELLFMDRTDLPTEEEQFNIYKKVAKEINPKTVIIRTMDIGGDKNINCINLPKEKNPFLGWRAIRISIDKIEILRTQLKAILRASVFGKIKIMFPMIISFEEVLKLKKEIEIAKKELETKNQKYNKKIKIGIMIETPSAALIASSLAKEVDFFSIGTNDLTQYTLAVDRGNDLVSHLYNPLAPSMLKLIKNIIDSSHKENKKTGMCGELASDPNATLLLLGMGLDEFSMNLSSILNIKKIIRSSEFSKAKKIAKLALNQNSNEDLKKILKYNI